MMLRLVSEKNEGVKAVRKSKTIDIVRRVGVITAERVHLRDYPLRNPVTIFNASLTIDGDYAVLYGRIVLGYFTYASAIAEMRVPIADIQAGRITGKHLNAEIAIIPDNNLDIWGCEDPRVCEVDNKIIMTYCGRTVNYFDASKRANRTLPIAAIRQDVSSRGERRSGEGEGEEGRRWRKICVFRLPMELRDFLISDKDAFVSRIGSNLRLFHRIHMMDERFYLVISEIPEYTLRAVGGISEVSVKNTALVFENADFEERIGWGTPPIEVAAGEYLFLLHSVCKDKFYRVFAVLMNEKAEVTAVTPHYIMEPRENYEVYGDRPFTVFPCGAQVIDDEIIISYGAADSFIGIGSIDISELLSVLDTGRF